MRAVVGSCSPSLAIVAAVALTACSAGSDPAAATSSTGPGGQGGDGAGGEDQGIAVGQGGDASVGVGVGGGSPAIGMLKGRVTAPQGSIPISGALVYLTAAPPPPVPQGAYCDACVEVQSSTSYTFSRPDGTFDLPAVSTGEQYLVTQKGQFRRVRRFTVEGGDQLVTPDLTRFPGRTDAAAGDDIPKMAVVLGAWDAIEESLEKLGIEPGAYTTIESTFDDFTAREDFLSSADAMKEHHIVFLPCSGSNGTDCNDFTADEPSVQGALQDFVGAGGKLYVTDYSYEMIRRPFPPFFTWSGATSETGSGCLTGSYTSPAQVLDPAMQAWLAAQNITDFAVEANWTMIDSVTPQQAPGPEGGWVDVEPKVWVQAMTGGAGNPATVSFDFGCGRGLFSTYHTEGDGGSDLLPQELALLYVLLEVGVCIDPPPVPN